MKKILAMILAAMMLLTVVGCGGGTSSNDKEDLVMATNANFPPYEYMEGDEYKGIDIEMAQKLAEKLGMNLVIENVEFGSIVGGVETKKFDIGVAGMTITEERKQQVNFSDSYATGIQVVIVKEGGKVASIDDLAGDDIMIGVQQDTTGDIYASAPVEEDGYGSDHVTSFKNGADAVAALVNGQVDAVIIDSEPAKSFVAANEGKGLSILDAEWAVEDYAIAINKEDTELLAKINAALAEMKADGTLQAIIDTYIKAE